MERHFPTSFYIIQKWRALSKMFFVLKCTSPYFPTAVQSTKIFDHLDACYTPRLWKTISHKWREVEVYRNCERKWWNSAVCVFACVCLKLDRCCSCVFVAAFSICFCVLPVRFICHNVPVAPLNRKLPQVNDFAVCNASSMTLTRSCVFCRSYRSCPAL